MRRRAQTLRRRVDSCASQLVRGCGDQWEAMASGWGRSDVPALIRSLRKALEPDQPLSLWTAQVKEALALARIDPSSRMALGSCLFKVFAFAVHVSSSAHDGLGEVSTSVDAVNEAARRIPAWLADAEGMFAVSVEPRMDSSTPGPKAAAASASTALVAVAVVNFSSDLVALAREFDAMRAAKNAAARGALFGEALTASANAAPGSLRDLDIDLPRDIRADINMVREGVAFAVVLRHLLGRLLEAHRVGEEAGDALQSALLPHRGSETPSQGPVMPLTCILHGFSGRSTVQLLLAPALGEVQVRV